MSFEIHYDISGVPVSTASEVESVFRIVEARYNNWGTRGFAFWLGPADSELDDFPLRIDVDPDAQAAAISWLPQNLIGAAPGFTGGRGIKVLEDSGEPLVDIPAERVRADPATAHRAAVEYVTTGRKPRNVQWHASGAQGS